MNEANSNPYEPPRSIAKTPRSFLLHSFLVASALAIVGGLFVYGFTKLETGNTRLSLDNALKGVFFGYVIGLAIAIKKYSR